MRYIIPTLALRESDVPLVGMKNYGLKKLHDLGLKTPKGFALTTEGFQQFMQENDLMKAVPNLTGLKNGFDVMGFQRRVMGGKIPVALEEHLCETLKSFQGKPIVVRSSSNYEDTMSASFAGQYDSVLNIHTQEELQRAVLTCFASTYSPRVFDYLLRQGIQPSSVMMPLVIQEMINAKEGVSGVILSTDPFSGSERITYVEASYGFGEGIVSGNVQPDSFRIRKDNDAIIHSVLGSKKERVFYDEQNAVYQGNGTHGFCLDDVQVKKLSVIAREIAEREGHPVDLEFILTNVDNDDDNEPTFVQVRPQIVKNPSYKITTTVKRAPKDDVVCQGKPVVSLSAYGDFHIFNPNEKLDTYDGKIVYVDHLDITYIPLLKDASGVIVKEMGLGSHPALILRELGLPSVTNIDDVSLTSHLKEGERITLDAATGEIIMGELDLEKHVLDLSTVPKTKTEVIVASTSANAYQPYRTVPVSGILMRGGEFTIVSEIRVHPQALLDYDAGKIEGSLATEIAEIIHGYPSAREFYLSKLSEGIALVGSLVSPETPLLYRFCDFPSSDYRKLIGGEDYEPQEENPMIGLRGVSRMLTPKSREMLDLEATAVRRVREDMGFTNLEILVAFCREPEDGKEVKQRLEEYGFSSCRIGMMVEVPSNYLCAREFAEYFDFFLVGPVDLTQTALAADRNNVSLARYHDPSGLVPKRAVETLLRNLDGCGKDVIIGSYALFQHLPDYENLRSNNRLIFAELADSLVPSVQKLYEIEKRIGLSS
jgi:pyruvate, water dikinase